MRDQHSLDYDVILIMGDFNLEPSDMAVQLFMDTRDLNCLIIHVINHKVDHVSP